MEYEILGGSFPVVECTLKAGESMITQWRHLLMVALKK